MAGLNRSCGKTVSSAQFPYRRRLMVYRISHDSGNPSFLSLRQARQALNLGLIKINFSVSMMKSDDAGRR